MLFILILVAESGCVPKRQVASAITKPAVKEIEGQEIGWWTAAFSVTWPEDVEPRWHVDSLVAHRVVRPVLSQHEGNIILWRFHRRAVRDKAGHRFSFFFYCSSDTARMVFDGLQANQDLQTMKAAGIIMEDTYDDTDKVNKPRVEDTSDPNWPKVVRRAWPYFIMGVSQTWLDLVALVSGDTPDGEPSVPLEDMLAFYKEIDSSVEALWRENGGHAFLHHLNGMFGYQNVFVYEKRLMTF
jgi:hypothetical protein